jgi:iron-sulfur cluster insertion protein
MEVTTEAVVKLKEVLTENGDDQSSLRVIAVPSEQGGVQYMMSLEKTGQTDDSVVTLNGLDFLVDSDSNQFLDGATIDYVEDFPRAGFVISNPAFAAPASGCGCGNGGSCGCGSGGCGGGH